MSQQTLEAPANGAIVRAESSAPALLRPVAQPAQVIEAHKEACAIIEQALEKDRDYGVIPGTGNKPTLLKPGAERLLGAFGLYVDTEVSEQECDHDRENEFRFKKWTTQKDNKPSKPDAEILKEKGLGRWRKGDGGWEWQTCIEEIGKSQGLYRYVVKATIRSRQTEQILGTGIGSCSTMESKYLRSPRDFENTVLKMAKKRALIDATLNTLGLSDRFTQDVEDLREVLTAEHTDAGPEDGQALAAAKSAPPPPKTPAAASASPEDKALKAAQTEWWTKNGGSAAQWAELGGRKAKIHDLVGEARGAGCTSVDEVLAYIKDGVLPGVPEVVEGELVEDSATSGPATTAGATTAESHTAGGEPSEPKLHVAKSVDPFVDGGELVLEPDQKRKVIATIKGSGLTLEDILRIGEAESASTYGEVLAIAEREVAALGGAK